VGDLQIWLEVVGRPDRIASGAIADALTRAGLTIDTPGADLSSRPGIVLFDELTPPLARVIHEAARGGAERVLAVATRSDALSTGGAWELIGAGAADVLAWDRSRSPGPDVAARFERWREIDRLVASPVVQQNLVGQSPAWKATLRQVVEAARFTQASVMLTGETGTGKELLARLVHTLDPRRQKRDLVVLDCTTIVPELAGSEFFGHERGAFTGAVVGRDGAFALADGGTLFLDEVGELSLPLQAQLLRVVQERTFKRVGGNNWQPTTFRLVSATNRDLVEEVAGGRFRRDLYYRMTSWVCHVPPLRERVEDIPHLVRHFIAEARPDTEPPDLDEAVRAYLLGREYPGNVRDLRQTVGRIVDRHVGAGPITLGDIPEDERRTMPVGDGHWPDAALDRSVRHALALGRSLRDISRAATDTAIQVVLADEAGNLQRAARRLGVTDRALQMRRASARLAPEEPGRRPLARKSSRNAEAGHPQGDAGPRPGDEPEDVAAEE
jgi:DNA-binding NtrC family response regulator